METGAVDYIQFDCNAHGGITEWHKIARMASMMYIEMTPHHEPVLHRPPARVGSKPGWKRACCISTIRPVLG